MCVLSAPGRTNSLFLRTSTMRLCTFAELLTQESTPRAHKQPAGAGNLSLCQAALTGCGLLAKTVLLFNTAPRRFTDQKENQKEMAAALTQSPAHQTMLANHSWPLRKQGQAPKAPRACFNKFSALRNYGISQSDTADISTDIPALCQSDSAIKQQKAARNVPKLARRMTVCTAQH